MKLHVLGYVLIAGWLSSTRLLGAEPAPTDIRRLVGAAATHESGQSLEPMRQIEKLVAQSTGNPALRQQLEAGLNQLVSGSATYEARRWACQQLAVVGSDAAATALAGLLTSEETVGIACLALANNPSTKANEVLRQALAALRGNSRVEVINALGTRQDTDAVGALAGLAREPDQPAAEAAVAALGKIADAPARQALAALRRAGNLRLADAVAEASLRVANGLATSDARAAAVIYEELLAPAQAPHVRRGALSGLLRGDQDGGQERILNVLHGEDALLKPVAIAAVRWLPSPGASETFARELSRLAAHEQVWLIAALAERNDAPARAAIRAQLAAPEAGVRWAAIAAVGEHDDASAVPLLAKALATANVRERGAIAQALSGLGGKGATDLVLIAELKQAAPEAKGALAAALARRGARVAVPALLLEVEGTHSGSAQAAFQALAKLAGPEDLPALLERLCHLRAPDARPEAEDAVRQTLLKVTDKARRTQLVEGALAQASEVAARGSLVRLLPTCGDAQALATLKAMRQDSAPPLQDAALRALAEWPDGAAWEVLAETYGQPGKDTHRTLALRALVRLLGDENPRPSAALFDRYRRLLGQARGDDDRKLLLGALSGLNQPEALALAVNELPNAGVRAEAGQAVKKIAEAIRAQHPQAAKEALEKLK